MTYQVSELPSGLIGIYKITFPNNKIYIGLSNDIKRRMSEHNSISKTKTPCDLAIKKYGKITTIDVIENYETVDRKFLEERESYWIKYYHSNDRNIGYNLTEGGDGSGLPNEQSPVSVFTNDQVLDIRKRRFNGERKKDVYKDYSNFYFSTFESVWLGRGYPDIGKEYIIPAHTKTRQKYSSLANRGLRNGRAKCSREEILEIRRRYDQGERVYEIEKDYPYSTNTISRVAKRLSFKDVE